MQIVVGTTSALKIQAVQAVFEHATVIGVKTNSGVPEQPLDEQTAIGAQNRLREARKFQPDADMFIGEAQAIGFDKITVGQVMYEAGIIRTKDDPHADLDDKIPRSNLLATTILAALEQLNINSHNFRLSNF